MKAAIKEILLEFYKSELPKAISRAVDVPNLPASVRKALVFIGMRRVGKTYLMYQDMNDKLHRGVNKGKLLYINFEDDRLAGFTLDDFQTLLDVYYELYPEYINETDLSFYFDEIQNIDGWEMFIRRLIDKEKMSLFITGSSAKLLSKEIATSLRGRCITTEVFPLSFDEYLKYHGIVKDQHLTSKEKITLKHYCKNYLKFGGFPETLGLEQNLHHQLIQSYVNAAVFRDVIERHQLKNTHIVKAFLIHCLQNIASPLSVNKVFNTFKSRGEELGRNSLYEYLSYFEDAYLICTVPIFEYSVRLRQVNPSKIYCVDSGIINGYSIKPETEISSSLENAAYIQLRRLHYENIFYYKTDTGKEVDFVAQRENGKIDLYQVCVDLSDVKTKEREVAALVEASKELDLKNATIITFEESDHITVDGVTIEVKPYWLWS